MEKYLQDAIECECGKSHFLKKTEIFVGADALEKMINSLSQMAQNKILIFYGLKESEILDRLKTCEILQDKELSFIILPDVLPTVSLVDKIEDKGQDVVVAIGNENIISFAKYYASCFSNPFVIFPVGNFLDFTFSKFARLYDGLTYNFYDTEIPCGIFVDTVINGYNEYQTYYIASKFVAVFDNQVAGLVFNQNFCPRMLDFLKCSLEKYVQRMNKQKQENNINNIWTLVRFGQAMTFFNQSKFFFGADKGVVDILSAFKTSCDYLETETIALKLIINSYDCFLQNNNYKADFNLNKHINQLGCLLKVPSSYIIKNLASSEYLSVKNEVINLFESYQPYLYGCFKNLASQIFKIQSGLVLKENILKKYGFTAKDIEKCFAVSTCLHDRATLLHLIGAFGYLDKLLG